MIGIIYKCNCPSCGESDMEEAKFRSCLTPELVAELDSNICSAPEGSQAMIMFSPSCPKCVPHGTHEVQLLFKAGIDPVSS